MAKKFFSELFKSEKQRAIEEEEKRLAEEKRKEEEKLAEKRRIEQERKQEEERIAEEKRKEEERLAEEKRIEEEKMVSGKFLGKYEAKYVVLEYDLEFYENIIKVIDKDEGCVHTYYNFKDKPTVSISNSEHGIILSFVTQDFSLYGPDKAPPPNDFTGMISPEDYSEIKTHLITFFKNNKSIKEFISVNDNKDIKTICCNFLDKKGKGVFLYAQGMEYVERKFLNFLINSDAIPSTYLLIDPDNMYMLENKDLEKFEVMKDESIREILNDILRLNSLFNEKHFTDKVNPIYTWGLLKFYAIKYYGDLFNIVYSKYFSQINDNSSINEFIESYFKIDEVDFKHLTNFNITFLTYFLMISKVFTDAGEIEFHNCFKLTEDAVLKHYRSIKDDEFEQSLLTPVDYTQGSKVTIDDIDLMSGYEFEEFISNLFKKLGYNSQVTSKSGDQGIDLIVEKNNRRYGIQTKCLSSKVSNKAIQEVVAGIGHYNCNKGIVVTDNYYTASAMELARSNSVLLWDRDTLKEKIIEGFDNIYEEKEQSINSNTVHFSNLTQAAFNILTILAFADGEFHANEQEVMSKFLMEQYDSDFNFDEETKAIMSSIGNFKDRFISALEYFNQNSTEKGKKIVFEYVLDTIFADDIITNDEKNYLKIVEELWNMSAEATLENRMKSLLG